MQVFPGEHNKGIFVRLTEDSPLAAKSNVAGEEYQITHPTASINGLLRGSLWVAICDTLYITCRGGGSGDEKHLRTIIEYKDVSARRRRQRYEIAASDSFSSLWPGIMAHESQVRPGRRHL